MITETEKLTLLLKSMDARLADVTFGEEAYKHSDQELARVIRKSLLAVMRGEIDQSW